MGVGMMYLIVNLLVSFSIAMVVWIGSAQLAVYFFGADSDLLIIIAVLGMVVGSILGGAYYRKMMSGSGSDEN